MSSSEWPPLSFSDWEPTCDTVHMWTQIVGKTRLAFEPAVNHWWSSALYVSPVGLTTSSVPYDGKVFEVEFDFLAHRLRLRTSDGRNWTAPLYPRSVADFYREYMSMLRSAGIEVKLNLNPMEFDDPTPFNEDSHHNSYDREYVERFFRVVTEADRIFKIFRSSFIGKCSPVHFFWGSFDLAVTRFSGRPAPPRADADFITREAYSHEVSSCGFWPGDRRFKHPAFYAYSAPSPAGLAEEPVRSGYWDKQLSEFILKYDDARAAASPEQAVLDFCNSTYEAGAKLAKWDRAALERRHAETNEG